MPASWRRKVSDALLLSLALRCIDMSDTFPVQLQRAINIGIHKGFREPTGRNEDDWPLETFSCMHGDEGNFLQERICQQMLEGLLPTYRNIGLVSLGARIR